MARSNKQGQAKQTKPAVLYETDPYTESNETKSWRKRLRSFALKALLPIDVHPTREELARMFVEEQSRFLKVLQPNTVTVWMYKSKSLNGLLYALLSRFTDSNQECFPAAMDQFSVFSDAELLNTHFSNTRSIPLERLCIIYLGIAGRNAYLTEVLNELVRHRLKRVHNSRTIFLFEGTRVSFEGIYGKVGECELSRDIYVLDWNPEAEACTNSRRCISEHLISRTVQSAAQLNSTQKSTPSAARQTVQKTNSSLHTSKTKQTKKAKQGQMNQTSQDKSVCESLDDIFGNLSDSF